jgi:NitT/TauT family transport system substrate-binding protein
VAQVRAHHRSRAQGLGPDLKRRGVLLATVGLAALGGRRAQAQAAPLHVIGPPNDGYKAVYYGVRSGIFRKYGVDVEATLINSGAAAAAALIGATADIAYTNATTLITAHNKNIPMQIVAPGAIFKADGKMQTAIVTLKDGPIRSGRDLIGKTVGSVSLGDTMAASIQAWIDQSGGDSHTVKIIEVPASAVVQMLQEGRVVAAAVNEPAASQAIATGNVRAIVNPNSAIAKTFLAAMFAVMAPAAEKNAEGMRRFAQGMHEASLYTNSHMAETVDLVAGYSGIAPDVVARSARFTDAEYADPALVQPVIDVLVKYAIIDHAFPAADIISPYALKRR